MSVATRLKMAKNKYEMYLKALEPIFKEEHDVNVLLNKTVEVNNKKMHLVDAFSKLYFYKNEVKIFTKVLEDCESLCKK